MSKLALLLVLFANLSYANVCKNYDLFTTKFTEKQDDLEANADNTSFSGKDIYNLSGNAEVYSSNYYINADEIEVKKSNKTIKAKNNVRIRTGDIYATGSSVELKTKNNITNIKTNNIKYNYKTTGANGFAKEFITTGEKQILKNSSYSFCQDNKDGKSKDWQIKAESITLDKSKNQGIAENVKLELFGIPVFWTPKYEWVLKGRESGFLFPSFSSYSKNNESGYQADIPYYFNLAPEKDLTLTLKNLSTRGQAINGLYRHLLAENKENGYFETEVEFLGDDDKTKNDRWSLNSKYLQKIGENADLKININRVSDKDYLEDISHNNSNTSINSNIKLNYEKDGLTASIFSESEQLISGGTSNYMRDLELYVNNEFTNNGVDFVISGYHTKFTNKDITSTTGDRTHINVVASKEIKDLSYSFKPHLKVNTTNYNLDNQDNKKRSSYSAGFDYKMFLERETNLFGKDILQTLTPRLSYLYTPKKDQTTLPNFDSSQSQITYNGLFSGDDWSGIDRISEANNITIGVDSNFIDNENGSTYANLGLARSYNVDTNIKSDIVANANFNYGYWRLNNTWQYNKKLSAKSNTVSYKKDGINFFSVGHHMSSNNNKSLSVYAAKPISGKSHIFAGLNRSTTENINSHQSIGFVYDDCCTAFRLAHFKEHNNDNNSYDKVIKFEVIFKGLGTTDKKLREKISAQIPNYLPEL
jgi:LPS-assembly protein